MTPRMRVHRANVPVVTAEAMILRGHFAVYSVALTHEQVMDHAPGSGARDVPLDEL